MMSNYNYLSQFFLTSHSTSAKPWLLEIYVSKWAFGLQHIAQDGHSFIFIYMTAQVFELIQNAKFILIIKVRVCHVILRIKGYVNEPNVQSFIALPADGIDCVSHRPGSMF